MKHDVRSILRSLERTTSAGQRVLHPADVVRAASDPKHPLHSRFEWSDTKAAKAYRLWQARELIAKVYVTYEDTKDRTYTVQAYHNIRSEGPGYHPTETIVRTESLRTALLRELSSDMDRVRDRLRRFRATVTGVGPIRWGAAQLLRAVRKERKAS